MELQPLCDKIIFWEKMKGLFCFDMEGVLVDGETLDTAASMAGVEKEIKELTKEAMEGKIDFKLAVKKRLELLKGFGGFEELAYKMPLAGNAAELIESLREQGHYVVMVTGGFDVAAKIIAGRLGVDAWFSHKIEIKNGAVTGNFQLCYNDKADILRGLREKMAPAFTVAIGDGANDLVMLREADIGIAFKAKQILKGKGFLCCEDMESMQSAFCSKGRSIAIDLGIHPILYKLFSAIGKVETADLSSPTPRNANVVIIGAKTSATRDFIESIPNLELIASATPGTGYIDAEFASLRRIKILGSIANGSDFLPLCSPPDDVRAQHIAENSEEAGMQAAKAVFRKVAEEYMKKKQ